MRRQSHITSSALREPSNQVSTWCFIFDVSSLSSPHTFLMLCSAVVPLESAIACVACEGGSGAKCATVRWRENQIVAKFPSMGERATDLVFSSAASSLHTNSARESPLAHMDPPNPDRKGKRDSPSYSRPRGILKKDRTQRCDAAAQRHAVG